MHRPNLRTFTTTWVALMVPVTVLVGVLTAAIFKSANPDNVDITQGLAYLQQTIIAVVVTFALFIVVSVVAIIKMYRKDHNFSNAKLPLLLLVAIIVLMTAVSITNSYTNEVQNKYLTDHGRPTLEQYFDALKNQQNQ
ncbi:MAG: hypothetical protein ABIP50_01020 [Candidatus Saccharimonadales bacterium]